MIDIIMTIACAAAIGGIWLIYSNSKVAKNIRFKTLAEYANIVKFLNK